MMEVLIRDLQNHPLDEELLRDAAMQAARVGLEAGDTPSDRLPDTVSVAIVDDDRIREINRSFRGTDATTDVIAFEAEDEPDRVAGEVIVSADTARRQAAEYGHSPQRELCLLVAHGVLHVLGYEDYDEDARGRMMALQQEALRRLEGGSTDLG
ncbi:MAG: rRNA maturation RNase YbeY [Armatimonadota bacterium]